MKFGPVFVRNEDFEGHVACVLTESDVPLMRASRPFIDRTTARQAARIMQAEIISPLAVRIADAFRRAGIFEPLAVERRI